MLQYQKAVFLVYFFWIYMSSGVMAFSQQVPCMSVYD